jgi:hypothetical protein
MPDLVNKVLGVTVSVSEAVAATLGTQWAPVDEPKEKPASRRSRKSDDD